MPIEPPSVFPGLQRPLSQRRGDFRRSEDCFLQAPFLSEPQFPHVTNKEMPHLGPYPALTGRSRGLGQSSKHSLCLFRQEAHILLQQVFTFKKRHAGAGKWNSSVPAEGFFFPQGQRYFSNFIVRC